MAYFHLNSGQIQECSVNFVTEPSGNVVLHFYIATDSEVTTYRVYNDDREPNIQQIYAEINSCVVNVKQNNSDLDVNEYLERSYIFVTLPNGSSKQYSANKI